MEADGAGDGDCHSMGAAAEEDDAEQPDSRDQRLPPGVEQKKTAGAEHFRRGSFEAALGCYGEALQALEAAGGADQAMRATFAANQALCLLKLERPAEAEVCAGVALVAQPANSKAVYRRGLARFQLGDVRGACEDLQKAARLEPQSREVRQRYEEARRAAESLPSDAMEVAVATGATCALGGAGGGLYNEKEDLNKGRLAETHKEQREWINSIHVWDEIKEVCFVDNEDKASISVYMTLPGLHELPKNKLCVWMSATSLEVRVVDLRETNWFWIAQELWGQIDPEASSWKVRQGKLSLKLQKRASARSWDRWEKLRRI